jgi:hypothetical protein
MSKLYRRQIEHLHTKKRIYMKRILFIFALLLSPLVRSQVIEWNDVWINTTTGYGPYGNTQCTTGAYTTLALNILSGSADLDPGAPALSIGEGVLIETISTTGSISEWLHLPGSLVISTLVRDLDQNTYVLGAHDAFADLQVGPVEYTTSYAKGIFLVKYDPFYNVVWMKEFPDMVVGGFDLLTNNVQYPNHFTLDASGNIYITGSFGGTIDFDPNGGIVNLTNTGQDDAFLLKLDNSGNFQWVISYPGFAYSHGSRVTVDSAGNPIVVGTFNSNIDVDPSIGIQTLSANGAELFVCKYTPAGGLLWAREIGETGSYTYGHKITCDLADNVFIQGSFSNQIDADPGAGTKTLNSGGADNILFEKLDSSGNFVWANVIHSTGYSGGSSAFTVDAFGNVYLGFYSEGETYVDPTNCSKIVKTENSLGVIASYDMNGKYKNHLTIGGNIDSYCFFADGAVDASDNLYLTGQFAGMVDMNSGPCYDPTDYGTTTGGYTLMKMNFSEGHCQFLKAGCTDITACNYNPGALCDDGNCIYSEAGCSNSQACNYNPDLYCSDNSTCVFPGCTYPDACNYNPQAGCDDGTCDFYSCTCEEDINHDGYIGIGDLLQFVGVYGSVCD